jgi:parallel beta-helix repeat protein
MKREIVAVWVSLVMMAGFVVIVDVVNDIIPSVRAATITVDDSGGADYLTIQEGINAANPGDTVYVYNGIYYENVVINQSINLTGEDRDTTIIDGGGSGNVVNTSVDWINITEFTVRNSGGGFQDYGIDIRSSNNYLSFCNISFNYNGIHIYDSVNNTIFNCLVVRNNWHAIESVLSSNVMISQCNISDSLYGLYIASCLKCTIQENDMQNNSMNVLVNGNKEQYNQTIDTSNNVNGKPVYYFFNLKDQIIRDLDAGHITIAWCNNITLTNISISTGDYIYVPYSFNSLITNFSVKNSYRGIWMNEAENNIISNGSIQSNYFGISNRGYNNTIEHCVINNNSYGIASVFASLIKIHNCEILNSTNYGILYAHTHDSIISKCNVSNNKLQGILFSNSANDDIRFCDISNNKEGIKFIQSSNNNHIYYNNIIDNFIQAYDENSNYWDLGYPDGGNYWSDYGGVDDFRGPGQNISGGDGIGDTPYIFDFSQDNYPLIDPYAPIPDNSIVLLEGWNLISIPLIQQNHNLKKVLETLDGYYDAVQWFDITDMTDTWKHNKIGKPFGNDLSHLNETMGFWIHITNPGDTTFLYNGTQPTLNQTITLHPGWNMVGYPSLYNRTRDNALNNIIFDQDVDAIWTFNAATQSWQEIAPSDFFELGQGYWIHSKVTKVWDVPL